MNTVVNKFMLLPSWGRAAILLFFVLIVFWRIFRKAIFWVISIIPFFLRVVFKYIYLAIEIPVAALHKKFGENFQKIDNHLSLVGEKIDAAIGRWYIAWHWPREYRFGRILLVYIGCMILVCVPIFIKTDNVLLKAGERIYGVCEGVLISWFERQEWYDPERQIVFELKNPSEDEIEEVFFFETTLSVSGVSSSLLVRDIPSVENGNILDRLKNGDIAVWRGEMCFSEADDKHVEPWVKIITVNGVEGWSRLYYLHPEPYVDIEFRVTN